MKLATANINEATLSNVGAVSTFAIKATAKSFSILSSGLYSNKIKAIIRELSCNALDSHVEAGKPDEPFEVHLPSELEPYFSVRDFGTGLSHEQVVNIYTTFFESTKTESNDFVGALGLGSKSPFSYTNNFTVTAIKDGVKVIFTAFINDSGVPSVALMGTDKDCSDANGVEVNFAVNSSRDCRSFVHEAENTFRHFAISPTILGNNSYSLTKVEYTEENIVEGVHLKSRGYTPTAVMGNISYPIEVPSAEDKYGELASLLEYPFEMHFELGELDFQASREGLSYIPLTIESIRTKLELISKELAVIVAKKVKGIKNPWEKAETLRRLCSTNLYLSPVVTYAKQANLPRFNTHNSRYSLFNDFDIDSEIIAEDHNIKIDAFSINGGGTTRKLHTKSVAGNEDFTFRIPFTTSTHFVLRDTNVGPLSRAKNHFRSINDGHRTVFVLSALDKSKDANYKKFLKVLDNPPNVINASSLAKVQRKVTVSNSDEKTVYVLDQRDWGSSVYVWRETLDFADFDKDEQKYYVQLKNRRTSFKRQSTYTVKELRSFLHDTKLPGLKGITINGLTEEQIALAKNDSTWVNLEDAIFNTLSSLTQSDIMEYVKNSIYTSNTICTYSEEVVNQLPDSSMFKVTNELCKKTKQRWADVGRVEGLISAFGVKLDLREEIHKLEKVINITKKKYPLLADCSSANTHAIIEYINFIDTK